MFTEALTYFLIAFFTVAAVGVALAGTGLVLLVRDNRALRADVTALPQPATAAGQEAA